MITENEVIGVIASSLEVDLSKITATTSMDAIEQWDSLAHLAILAALDEKLEGRASKVRTLAEAGSVDAIVKSLRDNQLIRN